MTLTERAPKESNDPVQHTEDTVDLVYEGTGDGLDEFYNDFKARSNVRSLKIEFWGTGCVSGTRPRSFSFQVGDKLPAIKKLSIAGYEFEDPPTKIEGVDFPEHMVDFFGPTNLEAWTEAMDFSQLEELHMDEQSTYFCGHMKDKLLGLHTLSMMWEWSREGASQQCVDFMTEIPALRFLTINTSAPWDQNWRNATGIRRLDYPFDKILEKHGSTLQSLSLHQNECDIAGLRRPMLTLEQISAIKSACPELCHIGLDIDRDGTWPLDVLNALMQIFTLTSVTIGLEIGADLHTDEEGEYTFNSEGLDGPGPWREPRVSIESAIELFTHLRRQKVGLELRSARFVVGNWGYCKKGRPLYMPAWEEGRSRVFECEVTDDVADGTTNLSCRVIERL